MVEGLQIKGTTSTWSYALQVNCLELTNGQSGFCLPVPQYFTFNTFLQEEEKDEVGEEEEEEGRGSEGEEGGEEGDEEGENL